MTIGMEDVKRAARHRIRAGMRERSEQDLRARLADMEGTAGPALAAVLDGGAAGSDADAGRGPGLVAVLSRRGPGDLEPDLPPVARSLDLARAGADAFGAVIEPELWGGDRQVLGELCAGTDRPVMVVDCILHPWQLLDGAAEGAGGALLAEGLLEGGLLGECLGLAAEHGLATPVAVEDAAGLHRALDAGACWIALPCTDPETGAPTDEALERALDYRRGVEGGARPVALWPRAEPGVAARLETAGFTALLLGTAETAREDAAARLRRIRPQAGR